jgi:tetratricopeptide (TPR) repeat protein
MSELYNIIATLNREESRNLKIFLNRTNASGSRKDVALFDFSKKNHPTIDESQFLEQQFYASDKNSFYRLKNRLQSDISKSLLLLHYNKTDYNNVVNQISLSRLYQQKGKYHIAVSHLKKAEKKAIKNEFFDLLDLIYSNLIRLSHESVEFNPIKYIEKRKKNHKSLHVLQEIDDVLAALIYRVKISQNFSTHNYQFTDLLQKTINDYIDSDEVKESSTLRFKIYHSISRILLQQNDFTSLEEYLQKTYYEFLAENLFDKSNHETKLQMLTYLVNSLFKNAKIKESLSKAEELHSAMREYDGLLYDKYLFYYYNSLVINYQVTDKQKAIEVLLEAKTKKAIQELPMFIVFIYLNLAVFYFDLKNYKEARKNLAKLKREESFSTLDNVFQLKIGVTELQVFYELGDIDLFDYQLNIVNKDFKSLLKKEDYHREQLFIKILSKLDTGKGKAEIKKFLDLYSEEGQADNDIINYTEWLKSKTKG